MVSMAAPFEQPRLVDGCGGSVWLWTWVERHLQFGLLQALFDALRVHDLGSSLDGLHAGLG